MQKKFIFSLIPLLLLGFGVYLIAGNNKTATQISNSSSSSTVNLINTKPGIEKASWGKNVKITYFDDVFQFQYVSNGLPNHTLADEYLIPKDVASQPFKDDPKTSFNVVKGSEFIKETTIDTKITLKPKHSNTVTKTSLGMIGVTISGAALYNDYENMERSVVALDDNVTHDHAAFVDECNGHPLQSGNSYHYHGVPKCVSKIVDVEGQHSTIIGALQDGFPFYGNKDIGGKVITNAELDECSGHTGATPEFPNGIYHYHLTEVKAPYSIDCYHGEIVTTTQKGPGGAMQQAPDLAKAAQTLGVTEQALKEALGNTMPPDFEAASKKLGITAEKLKNSIGAPPAQ
jgi:YHYH protein